MKPDNFLDYEETVCLMVLFHSKISMIFITSISCYSGGIRVSKKFPFPQCLNTEEIHCSTQLILFWDVKHNNHNIFFSVTILKIFILDLYSENFIFQNCTDNTVK